MRQLISTNLVDNLSLSRRSNKGSLLDIPDFNQQLIKLDYDELMRIRNMGYKSAREIIDSVNKFGIEWLAQNNQFSSISIFSRNPFAIFAQTSYDYLEVFDRICQR